MTPSSAPVRLPAVVTIAELRTPDDVTVEVVDAINQLLPQLSSSAPPLTTEDLTSLVTSEAAHLLVARADNAQSPAIRKLAAALNSPEVRKFIQTRYKGAVVPAF